MGIFILHKINLSIYEILFYMLTFSKIFKTLSLMSLFDGMSITNKISILFYFLLNKTKFRQKIHSLVIFSTLSGILVTFILLSFSLIIPVYRIIYLQILLSKHKDMPLYKPINLSDVYVFIYLFFPLSLSLILCAFLSVKVMMAHKSSN